MLISCHVAIQSSFHIHLFSTGVRKIRGNLIYAFLLGKTIQHQACLLTYKIALFEPFFKASQQLPWEIRTLYSISNECSTIFCIQPVSCDS